MIAGENAEDYSALLNGLMESITPEGMLEQMLVEKVAVALWRQKRLVEVEAATIDLEIMSVSNKITTPDETAMNGYFGIAPPTKAEMALRQVANSAPVDNELLARYMVGLDNELYRAIEALRKQQEFRFKNSITIETELA